MFFLASHAFSTFCSVVDYHEKKADNVAHLLVEPCVVKVTNGQRSTKECLLPKTVELGDVFRKILEIGEHGAGSSNKLNSGSQNTFNLAVNGSSGSVTGMTGRHATTGEVHLQRDNSKAPFQSNHIPKQSLDGKAEAQPVLLSSGNPHQRPAVVPSHSKVRFRPTVGAVGALASNHQEHSILHNIPRSHDTNLLSREEKSIKSSPALTDHKASANSSHTRKRRLNSNVLCSSSSSVLAEAPLVPRQDSQSSHSSQDIFPDNDPSSSCPCTTMVKDKRKHPPSDLDLLQIPVPVTLKEKGNLMASWRMVISSPTPIRDRLKDCVTEDMLSYFKRMKTADVEQIRQKFLQGRSREATELLLDKLSRVTDIQFVHDFAKALHEFNHTEVWCELRSMLLDMSENDRVETQTDQGITFIPEYPSMTREEMNIQMTHRDIWTDVITQNMIRLRKLPYNIVASVFSKRIPHFHELYGRDFKDERDSRGDIKAVEWLLVKLRSSSSPWYKPLLEVLRYDRTVSNIIRDSFHQIHNRKHCPCVPCIV